MGVSANGLSTGRLCEGALTDAHGRQVSYLRLSITNRCNLHCFYCRFPGQQPAPTRGEELTAREIINLAGLFVEQGVRRIRITGGEPLLRPDVEAIVAGIAQLNGIEEVTLSTNGLELAAHARRLAQAGLARVNVSVDTLHPGRSGAICGAEIIERVFAGIEAAEAEGLGPIKLNTVLLRGRNDDEIIEFVALTRERPWTVRFIELMPLVCNQEQYQDLYLSTVEVRDKLQAMLSLEPAACSVGDGPATYYRIPGARGLIGFISPLCENFCGQCNRIRLTSTGRIRPCLFSEGDVDLAGPYRAGLPYSELEAIVRQGLANKPAAHELAQQKGPRIAMLLSVGG